MRTVVVKTPMTVQSLEGTILIIKENVEYVLPEGIRDALASKGVVISDVEYNPANKYNGEDLNGKKLTCFRSGGIGDLIFITSALKQLKKKYPDADLNLSCDPSYSKLFVDDPDFNVLPMPVEYSLLEKSDYTMYFQKMIEENPEAEKVNAYDIILRVFKLQDGLVQPKVHFSEEELNQAKKIYKPNAIVLQIAASVPKRSIPLGLIQEIIVKLPQYNFFIAGSNIQQNIISALINSLPPACQSRVVNLSQKLPTLRGVAAFISLADLVIGPDSSILHIAGAVGTKLIGLYGPFPSDLRLRYYKNAIGIDANSNCEFARGEYKSCFEHGNGSCRLAVKTFGFYAPCMELIKFDHVIAAMEKLGVRAQSIAA